MLLVVIDSPRQIVQHSKNQPIVKSLWDQITAEQNIIHFDEQLVDPNACAQRLIFEVEFRIKLIPFDSGPQSASLVRGHHTTNELQIGTQCIDLLARRQIFGHILTVTIRFAAVRGMRIIFFPILLEIIPFPMPC